MTCWHCCCWNIYREFINSSLPLRRIRNVKIDINFIWTPRSSLFTLGYLFNCKCNYLIQTNMICQDICLHNTQIINSLVSGCSSKFYVHNSWLFYSFYMNYSILVPSLLYLDEVRRWINESLKSFSNKLYTEDSSFGSGGLSLSLCVFHQEWSVH